MKNKKLQFFTILVGIAIVVVAGFGIWKMNQDVENTNPNPNENQEFSDWQTYRNEEYGFEVKYPQDWKDSFNQSNVNEYSNGLVEYKNLLYKDIWGESQKEGSEFYDGAYFKISIVKDSKNLNFEDFLKINVENSEKVAFNNISAFQTSEKMLYGDNIIEQSSINTLYFEYKGDFYRIVLFATGPDYISFENVLQEIKSSFKF